MKPLLQELPSALEAAEAQKDTCSPARPKRKNLRPPQPEDFKQLCTLCRAGKLFAVEDWFKTHKYNEPEGRDRRHWPMGIAIEKGFHSLAEVLLENGVPADARALEM